MYINWAHHWIPKISGTFSILINALFIFIVSDDSKVFLGNYRYLLIFFAIYNFASTAIDLLVPMCVLDYKHAFSLFIAGGYFEEKSDLGAVIISIRCSFIPAAYGILQSHFIYRYMVLFNRPVLSKYFLPYGLLLTVIHCLMLMIAWFPAAYVFLTADEEREIYMADIMKETFDEDVHNLNIIIALYNEASREVVRNSWIGILIATFISVDSVLIYIIFGTLIIFKLKSGELLMSEKTKELQKQLMKALMVQAFIPMVVAFSPCMLAWYLPVFGWDIGNWIHWSSAVAISFFPVLDPLALFYFIPIFRIRVRKLFHILAEMPQNAISTEVTGMPP